MKKLISWNDFLAAFAAYHYELIDTPVLALIDRSDENDSIYISWTNSEGEEYNIEINFPENVPDGIDADFDTPIMEVNEEGHVTFIDGDGDKNNVWFYKKFNPFSK